jgi:hypothetical protein
MNWYHPIVYYGYELTIPSDIRLEPFILMLHDLNHMMMEPFQIKAILSSFPGIIEDCDIHSNMVNVVIGFSPLDVKELHQHLNALHVYVKDTILLDGMEVAEEAQFFSGIEWIPEAEDESDVSDEESDEVSEEDNDFSG